MAATNIGGVAVTALVNTKQFVKGMAKVKKTTSTTFKGVQKAFDTSSKQAKQLGDKVEILGKSFDYSSRKFKKATVVMVDGIKQQSKATEGATQRIRVMIKATLKQISAAKALAKINRKGGQGVPRGQRLLGAGRRMSRSAGTGMAGGGGGGGLIPTGGGAAGGQGGGGSFLKLGAAIGKAGGTLIGAALLRSLPKVAFALDEAVSAAREFEKEFAVVRSITTGGASDFDKLEGSIKKLSSTTEHGNVQIIRAAEVLGRAGFEAQDIGEALSTVADLASAGGLRVSEAASLSVRMLKAFGKSLDELPEIADMLAAASANANVNIQGLAEGFKFTGAIAETSGLRFSDVTTALSLLGETGLEAGLAGRALQAAIMDLAKPTDTARDKLFKMGIITEDAQGKMLPLGNILRQLKDANMTAADSFKIFNRNSARAVTALVRNVDKYKDFEEMVRDSSGAIEDQSRIVRGTFDSSMKQLASSIENVASAIGEKLLPKLSKLAKFGARGMQGLQSIIEGSREQLLFSDEGGAPSKKNKMNFMFRDKEGNLTPVNQDTTKKVDDDLREAEGREAQAAELRRKKSIKRLLQGDDDFVGAIERFENTVRLTMLEGEEAFARLDLEGVVKSIFKNIFTDLSKKGSGISPQEAFRAVDAAMTSMLDRSSTFAEKAFDQDKLNDEAAIVQREVEAFQDLLKTQFKEMSAEVNKSRSEITSRVQSANQRIGNLDPRVQEELQRPMASAFGIIGISGDLPHDPSQTKEMSGEEQASILESMADKGEALQQAFAASDQVFAGLLDTSIGMLGDIGNFGNTVASASAGGPMAMGAAALMALMQETEGFKAITHITTKAFESLVKVVEPLMEPLFMIVDIFMQVVEGLADFLVPIMEGVAFAITGIVKILTAIVNSIIKALNFLLPKKFELDELGKDRDTFDETMAKLGDETEDTTDKFKKLNEELIDSANVAAGFKLNLRAFQAALGSPVNTVASRTRLNLHAGGVVPGVGEGDAIPAMLTPGETVIPRGGAAGGVVIQTLHVHVADTKDFMRKLTREEEFQNLVRTGSPIKGKLAGIR